MISYVIDQSDSHKVDDQDLLKMRDDSILQLMLNVQNVVDYDDCAKVLIEKDIYQVFIRNLRFGKAKVENDKAGA